MEEQVGNNSNKPAKKCVAKPILKAITVPIAKPIDNSIRKFWTNTSGAYKIDPESLHKFLGERGYQTYKPEGVKATILVKVDNKKLKEISPKEIRKVCWDYIDSEYVFSDSDERRQVKSEFQHNRSLFSKDNLELLAPVSLKERKDTKQEACLFFIDCVLEITPTSIRIKDYKDIEGMVLETDISKHYLKPFLPPCSTNIESIKPGGEFYEFVKDLCKNDNLNVSSKSLESIVTIIGYLVHRYKDLANTKAIIFMDTYKDGNANGSTGKGVFTKAIGRIRESAFQDGKFFTSSDRFVFSHVHYGTRLLIIDDVPKNFDFEKLFPLITEKAVIERKYENKIVIPYEESPKVIITTNYTVEGAGSSHRRRKVEFILSEVYTDTYSPEDRFGHLLFVEWDETEWKNFYLFIAYCLQEFLKKGIIKPVFNVGIRKLKSEATPDFIEYIHNNVEPGVKLNKQTLYDNFYTKFPGHYKIELTTFRNWLKYFADAYDYKMMETHSGPENFFEYC